MAKKLISVKCPYCGVIQQCIIELELVKPIELLLCEINDGGCDKHFVVETHIEVTTKARRIEGEDT